MHLYHDYETLDVNPITCITTNAAYVAFDFERFTSDNPYTFEELLDTIVSFKFLGKEQKELGWSMSKSTLDFWKSLPDDVRQQIYPSEKDRPINEYIDGLIKYSKKHEIQYWWSQGNNFDCVITKRLFEQAGKNVDTYLPYYGPRDTRTYLDTRFNFGKYDRKFMPIEGDDLKKFRQHNCVHDVAIDILRIQMVERELNGE